MYRINFLGAVVLIVMTGAIQARAAAPDLPPNAIAADTILVVHVEAAHFTPDQLIAARTALFGPDGAKPDDQMKKFKESFDKAIAAGAEAVTIVGGEPTAPDAVPLDDSPAVFYVRVKAGADVKALKAALASMSAGDPTAMLFEEVDHFLVMHDKSAPVPQKADAGRRALFAEALGTIGDGAIQIVFIPDPLLRDLMVKMAQRAPKGVKEAVPQLAASEWTAIAINLGSAPGFSITIDAGAEADAKALTENINAGLAELKEKFAAPAGPGREANPAIGPMIEGLRPVQSGAKVAIVAKPETVKLIAALVLKMKDPAPQRQ